MKVDLRAHNYIKESFLSFPRLDSMELRGDVVGHCYQAWSALEQRRLSIVDRVMLAVRRYNNCLERISRLDCCPLIFTT